MDFSGLNNICRKLIKYPCKLFTNRTFPGKKMYGFYSQTARMRGHGYYQFKTPKGEIIIVTTVTNQKDGEDYKWDDKLFISEVMDYISGPHEKCV